MLDGQDSQVFEVWVVRFLNVPAGQSVQGELSLAALNLPAAQAAIELPLPVNPALARQSETWSLASFEFEWLNGQSVQLSIEVAAVIAEYVFTGQLLHPLLLVIPVSFVHLPAGQLKQGTFP